MIALWELIFAGTKFHGFHYSGASAKIIWKVIIAQENSNMKDLMKDLYLKKRGGPWIVEKYC